MKSGPKGKHISKAFSVSTSALHDQYSGEELERTELNTRHYAEQMQLQESQHFLYCAPSRSPSELVVQNTLKLNQLQTTNCPCDREKKKETTR